jgi:hypothetical protein
MSALYFNHSYVSNSDLKSLFNISQGIQQPENLDAVFDFGTKFHAGILEPNTIDLRGDPDEYLIKRMHDTFFADRLCRDFILMPDFRREHEFYREDVHGLKAKCKMDGSSKAVKSIMELKGLKANSHNAFYMAIDRFDYDQGAAWYLDVSKHDQCLIAAISKTDPKKMFKVLIDRDHHYYKSGVAKIQHKVAVWKMWSLDGQNII